MARNRYYNTSHWRHLKQATHERDHWICVVEGCNSTQDLHCDHIKTRPHDAHWPTEFDVITNTRTLCGFHDRQRKERTDGTRHGPADFKVKGCDAQGWPADPNHPWMR